MLSNLKAEMVRAGLSSSKLAAYLKKSRSAIDNKIAERSEFTYSEIIAIQRLFPWCATDYLFKSGKKQEYQDI